MRLYARLSRPGYVRLSTALLSLRQSHVLAFVLLACLGSLFSTTQRAASTQTGARAFEASSKARALDAETRAGIKEAYGKLPLGFEVNEGQADASVKFSARGSGYGLFLKQTEAVLALTHTSAQQNDETSFDESPKQVEALKGEQATTVLRMRLKGANPASSVTGTDELEGKVHYLKGRDRSGWHTDVETYAKVRYEDVYKHVDLVYYGNQGQLEYDFEVAPGGQPDSIKLAFEGMQKLALDGQGDLLLKTKGGDVRWHKPVVYQLVKGQRRAISARYLVNHRLQEVSFKIGSYDRSKPLVIDPTLVYSTFFGGSNPEQGYGIAVDASGSAYITGSAYSGLPVTAGSFQPNYSGVSSTVGFVTKLNSAGSAVVYSTYLGGSSGDAGYGIAVDANGNAHVAGVSCSTDFPVLNAFQPSRADQPFDCDAFLTKLNATGSALLYSTYLGGFGTDMARGIALDDAGNAYITGDTAARNFPTLGAAQPIKSGRPVFKTTDGASTWNEASNGLTASTVNALVSDPSNPATLYAATDAGIYKTTDGGNNWTGSNNGITNDTRINALVLDPGNASTIYAGDNSSCIYKSTDAGSHWTITGCYSDGIEIVTIYALAISPAAPSTIYAGGAGERYLTKSTNGGLTWNVSNGIISSTVLALAADPTNASLVYAGSSLNGIYKSTDGGVSWTTKNNGLSSTFVYALAIDPGNPSTIYAGTSIGVSKSTNAGETWTAVNNGLSVPNSGTTSIAQVRSLAISQSAPLTIYAGCSFGGVFKSTDGGANWSPANNGLTNGFIKALAVNQTNAATLYAGASSGLDVFVSKFSPAGSLLYSTYLGGSETESGNGIAVDASGSAYLTGSTASPDFPALNPAQASLKSLTDGFVTKLNPGGAAIAYSTYLGGTRTDVCQGIAVDSSGSAYVTGQTSSANFPTTAGAFDTTCGTEGTCNQNFAGSVFADAFATKLTPAGTAFAYSTYLGGSATDTGYGVAVKSDGRAYVTGGTTSNDFPTVNPVQASRNNAQDVFILKLNDTGAALEFSTYLGGGSNDIGRAIAVDAAGSAYLTGTTNSFDFPTANAVQPVNGSGGNGSLTDAFIVKIGNLQIPPVFQFSASSYNVNESGNFATITVTRTGNIAGASTVDYGTSDGTAHQRSDYTLASGTLSFAAGEASKSFTVLITDNAFVDGNRTINLTLSNPTAGTIGTQGTAILNILDNDTNAPTTNPIDDAQFFVRQQYADFLNRAPDAGGLGYWTNQITQCGNDAQCIHDRRVGVADAFFFEPEFQQTGAYIYRIYKAAIGARPTYAQFISDRGRVVAGPGLDQSKTDYALYFVRTAAFQQEYGTATTADQFVDRMLTVVRNYSGVDLSAQRSSLISLYNGTDAGKAAILRQVAESQQFIDAEYNNSFVLMEYFGYLRRDPDQGGFDFWLAQVNKFPLRNVGIQHAMACSFITSAEYQTRFSSIVTHNNSECPQ